MRALIFSSARDFFRCFCKCSQLEESVCMLPDGHSIAGCIFCDIPADRCSYFSMVTPVSQCFRHVTLSSPTVIKIKMCHRQLSIELTSAIHWFFHSWPLVLVYYSCSSHEFSLSFMPFWRTWLLVQLWVWRIWSKQIKWAPQGSSLSLRAVFYIVLSLGHFYQVWNFLP